MLKILDFLVLMMFHLFARGAAVAVPPIIVAPILATVVTARPGVLTIVPMATTTVIVAIRAPAVMPAILAVVSPVVGLAIAVVAPTIVAPAVRVAPAFRVAPAVRVAPTVRIAPAVVAPAVVAPAVVAAAVRVAPAVVAPAFMAPATRIAPAVVAAAVVAAAVVAAAVVAAAVVAAAVVAAAVVAPAFAETRLGRGAPVSAAAIVLTASTPPARAAAAAAAAAPLALDKFHDQLLAQRFCAILTSKCALRVLDLLELHKGEVLARRDLRPQELPVRFKDRLQVASLGGPHVEPHHEEGIRGLLARLAPLLVALHLPVPLRRAR